MRYTVKYGLRTGLARDYLALEKRYAHMQDAMWIHYKLKSTTAGLTDAAGRYEHGARKHMNGVVSSQALAPHV